MRNDENEKTEITITPLEPLTDYLRLEMVVTINGRMRSVVTLDGEDMVDLYERLGKEIATQRQWAEEAKVKREQEALLRDESEWVREQRAEAIAKEQKAQHELVKERIEAEYGRLLREAREAQGGSQVG